MLVRHFVRCTVGPVVPLIVPPALPRENDRSIKSIGRKLPGEIKARPWNSVLEYVPHLVVRHGEVWWWLRASTCEKKRRRSDVDAFSIFFFRRRMRWKKILKIKGNLCWQNFSNLNIFVLHLSEFKFTFTKVSFERATNVALNSRSIFRWIF